MRGTMTEQTSDVGIIGNEWVPRSADEAVILGQMLKANEEKRNLHFPTKHNDFKNSTIFHQQPDQNKNTTNEKIKPTNI